MNLTEKNLFKYLKDYSERIYHFINNETIDEAVLKDLLNDFDDISVFLILSDKTPKIVKDYISAENFDENTNLPEDYSEIKSVLKLREYITKKCTKNIKNSIKNKNFTDIIKYISIGLKADNKNTVLAENIAEMYKENELYSNLIELYRIMFIYTENPLYFEKIGDTYYDTEKFNEAIDSYLNCAEATEDYVQIYEKLAKTFGKVNDNESRIACLNHIKQIGGKNV